MTQEPTSDSGIEHVQGFLIRKRRWIAVTYAVASLLFLFDSVVSGWTWTAAVLTLSPWSASFGVKEALLLAIMIGLGLSFWRVTAGYEKQWAKILYGTLISVIFGVLAACLSALICFCFLFASGRAALNESLGTIGIDGRQMLTIFVVGGLSGVVCTAGMIWRRGLTRTVRFATAQGLAAAFVVFAVAIPVHRGVALQDNDDLTYGSTLVVLLALLVLLWMAGAFLVTLGRRDGREALGVPHAIDRPHLGVDGREYVSWSRTLSLTLLVLAYVSYTVARSYGPIVHHLSQARSALATRCLLEQLTGGRCFDGEVTSSTAPCDAETQGPSAVPIVTATEGKLLGVGTARLRIQNPRKEKSQRFALEVSGADTTWQVVGNLPDGPLPASISHQACETRLKTWTNALKGKEAAAKPDLRDIALRVDSAYAGKPEDLDLYRHIDHTVRKSEATIPGLGMSVPLAEANLVIALLLFPILVVLRNQIRLALEDPKFGNGEPWLAIDGRTGLEGFVAAGWIAAIALSPWVVNGCLIFATTSRIAADGTSNSVARDMIRFSVCVALTAASGWAALTAVSQLLRLRRERSTLGSEPGADQPGMDRAAAA